MSTEPRYFDSLGGIVFYYIKHELLYVSTGGYVAEFEYLAHATTDEFNSFMDVRSTDDKFMKFYRYGEYTEQVVNERILWFQNLLEESPDRFDTCFVRRSDGERYGDATSLALSILSAVHVCYNNFNKTERFRKFGYLPFVSGILRLLIKSKRINVNRFYSYQSSTFNCTCSKQRLSWFIMLAASNLGDEVLLSLIKLRSCKINAILHGKLMTRVDERIFMKILKHKAFDSNLVPTNSLYSLAMIGDGFEPYTDMYNLLVKLKAPLTNAHYDGNDGFGGDAMKYCISLYCHNGSKKRFLLLCRFIKSTTKFSRLFDVRDRLDFHPTFNKRLTRVMRVVLKNECFQLSSQI